MAQRIAGIAFFKVDGAMLPLRGNFTVSPSAVERTMLAGQDYVHGYQELPRVPWIEGDVTATPELANEKVYVLKQAACKSALENNAREGQVRVRFEGTTCEEISG